MTTDKLELKHIAPYLNSKVKALFHDEVVMIDGVADLQNKLPSDIYENKHIDGFTMFYRVDDFRSGNALSENFKLILRPLSDLYKEIDGVVHIVELAKIACRTNEIDFSLKHLNKAANIVFLNPMFEFGYGNQEGFYLYDGDEERERVINQLNLFSYLFEHHFDIYGLIDKGLAIDINTIK